MTPALQSLPDACLVGLARDGRPPNFRLLNADLPLDGLRIFQDLRDTFALLRRHRVAVHRLLWEFEGGCLLASQHNEVLRCLVTRRCGSEVEDMWPLLGELQ